VSFISPINRNMVAREHSRRAIKLSASIGVRRFERIEWIWKMRSNLSMATRSEPVQEVSGLCAHVSLAEVSLRQVSLAASQSKNLDRLFVVLRTGIHTIPFTAGSFPSTSDLPKAYLPTGLPAGRLSLARGHAHASANLPVESPCDSMRSSVPIASDMLRKRFVIGVLLAFT
jgi:hypothetical protein